jgi:hypothetical protein
VEKKEIILFSDEYEMMHQEEFLPVNSLNDRSSFNKKKGNKRYMS